MRQGPLQGIGDEVVEVFEVVAYHLNLSGAVRRRKGMKV